MTWNHRFIITKNQDVVLAEILYFNNGEILGWSAPYLQDVTQKRLIAAWRKGPLLEADDGSLSEKEDDK